MATTSIKLLFDNVLIDPDPVECAYKSDSIVIPDIVKGFDADRPRTGKIVNFGPECNGLKKGEKVIYSKWGGAKFIINEKEHVIMKHRDILAIDDRS